MENEYQLHGKLKTLVHAFKHADASNDETEIIALIELLEKHKWDVEKLSLQMMLEDHYMIENDDLLAFKNVKEEALAVMPSPKISEEEKLDKILEMGKLPVVNFKPNDLKGIVEALKYDNDLTP